MYAVRAPTSINTSSTRTGRYWKCVLFEAINMQFSVRPCEAKLQPMIKKNDGKNDGTKA